MARSSAREIIMTRRLMEQGVNRTAAVVTVARIAEPEVARAVARVLGFA